MRDDVPALLLTAAVLFAILGGSFLYARANLIEGDETRSAETLGVTFSAEERQLCRSIADCSRPSARLLDAFADPGACEGTSKRICFVPMGDFPVDLIDDLVAHFQTTYDLDVRVLPPLQLPRRGSRGEQINVDQLQAQMIDAYGEYATSRSVTLIGLTGADVYLGSRPSSKWAFGQIHLYPESGFKNGVVSIHRMDPRNWDGRSNGSLRDARALTMVSKYVALDYFNLPVSEDPRSVTYGGIGGLADLDRMTDFIELP